VTRRWAESSASLRSISQASRSAPPEPATPEEEAGVAEARAEIERGELISADEIRREFG